MYTTIKFYRINRDSYFIDNNVKNTTAPPKQDHGPSNNKETTISIANIGSMHLTPLSIRIYQNILKTVNCCLYDKNIAAKQIVHDVRHIQQQSVFMFLQVGTLERIIDDFTRLKRHWQSHRPSPGFQQV